MPREDREELIQEVLARGREQGAANLLFHSSVAAHLGLGATEVKALDLLQRNGPMTPKDLGEGLGIVPSSVTGLLRRLESRELAIRLPHSHDGRRIVVRLHESTGDRISPLFITLESELRAMLADRTDDELRLIAALLAELAERLRRATPEEGTSPPTPPYGPHT